MLSFVDTRILLLLAVTSYLGSCQWSYRRERTSRVLKAQVEETANLDSLAPRAPLVPLDSEETLLLSMMVQKVPMPAPDPWVCWAPEVPLDHLDPLELRDTPDTLVSPESPDRLAFLVLVAPLDPLANLERTVTMADLASPETEVPPAHRELVDSPELLDFQE
ncbi:hypothetical protein F7725_024958 [Dissostichus mawsoni]|uniref:Uncharacterized protein n=2 Tax=Dissostichus TaxID=36199 RepID=A0A7J5X9R7_DISMA|nr:hypothetical protein F7725_024958 [Dissostichus mawsoni]KAK1880317.1 Collagen alpha-2(I) chain [Dissostichus eleginoides]